VLLLVPRTFLSEGEGVGEAAGEAVAVELI